MREVSATALQAMLAQETEQVFLMLLRMEHADLAAPILLAKNNEVVSRTDGDYLPYRFDVNLPDQSDDETMTVTLTVDNTDLEVNNQIRSLTGKPTVTLMVVLASSPNVTEYGPVVMSLRDASGNAESIHGTLGQEDDVWVQSVPGQQYTPSNSHGAFV